MDNDSPNKHARTNTWLAHRSRWHIHFIPAYSSWLNEVEHFYEHVIEEAIPRGSFRGVKDLAVKIDHFVTHYNKHGQPFI